MSFLDFLIGRPIPSSDERAQQIGVIKGVPIFGLDALSSAAYGPEAGLTLLIPLGVAGLHYIFPLSLCIIALLIMVFFSYRQTIAAYPGGGGSYTVARENLGVFPGLLAASALMIDYVLTAAVGISAGIGALVSAVPSLHSRTLMLCLAALLVITLVNLRGVSETGGIFMVPTYLFLLSMLGAIVVGLGKTVSAGGNPTPMTALPQAKSAAEVAGFWLLIKAFSSGCTAITGVEAVSNGVKAFREPTTKIAQRTLGIIICSLTLMLGGIAFLVQHYKIVATDPNSEHYQSVLSLMFLAIAGRGWFYYLAMVSVLLVLIFSANTAFADFPRVCRIIAEDRFLPVSLAGRGRRLVYAQGIIVLAFLAATLLIAFGGVTDRLIPLYAVGAFLAFTLSQAGMVAHWRRQGGAKSRQNMLVNGLGATATGATVVVVILAKFAEGAWITVVTIPALLALMYGVKKHYNSIQRETASPDPLDLAGNCEPIVIIPVQQWSKIAKHALCAALAISKEIITIYVTTEDQSDDFRKDWGRNVAEPIQQAKGFSPELVVLQSPYRFVVNPIVDFVLKKSADCPDRRIIAIVPELVEHRWYNYFLHSQRSTLLKTMLLVKGNDRISVLNIPWYFK